MQPRTMRIRVLQGVVPLRGVRWFLEGYQVADPVLSKSICPCFRNNVCHAAYLARSQSL